MGCCCGGSKPNAFKENLETLTGLSPCMRERDSKYYYELTFTSKPLHITITSSKENCDAYVTAFDKDCPIPDVGEKLALNSKLIKVNGNLVEGCLVTMVAKQLAEGKLPMRLLL